MVSPASAPDLTRSSDQASSQPIHPLTSLAISCLKQVQAVFSFCHKKILFLSHSIFKLSSFFEASFRVTAYKCHSIFKGDQRPLLEKALKEKNSLALEALKTLKIVEIPKEDDMLKSIEQGADLNAVDREGKTLAHTAATYGYCRVLKALAEKNANLNAVDRHGNSPASFAALFGHLNILEFLASEDVDLQAAKDIAHNALISRNLQLIDYLARAGVDLNAVDGGGNTLAHIAVFNGNLQILEFLAWKGVNLQAANTDGQKPIDYARDIADNQQRQAIVDFLEKHA